MYRITIMRHKIKMIWLSINKLEGNVRKDEEHTDSNADEESKTEELSQGQIENKAQKIAEMRELANERENALETFIKKITNDSKMK